MHTTTGISSTHQACAACKHQRKRCTDKCILAPFFPAEKFREFQAVHKVFGVSNVQKIVRNLLNNEDRKRAADSLVWEALCRQKDPILGPYGEYQKIYNELKIYQTQTQFHHEAGQFVAQNGHNNSSVYKTGNGLIGWSVNTNGSCGINNKGTYSGEINNNIALVDCIRAQCASLIGSGLYSNCGSQDDLHGVEKIRQDVDASVGSVIPPQQHLMNEFSHHYYLPGQMGQMDAKSLESSLWEAES